MATGFVNQAGRWWLAGVLAMATMLPRAGAVEPQPLPAFEVQELTSGTIASDHLASGSRWIVLYIQRECGACETALQLLKQREQHPNLSQHLVIMGGMTLPELRALSAKYPDLSVAHWVADPTGTAFHALKLQGAPVTLGLRGKTIAWTVNGLLGDPQQFRSILESWTN